MTDSKYIASDLEVESDRQRLRLQEQILDPTTIRHLELIGVAPGWKCLNVGAGYGSITSWLAERVGPTGKAVGTEVKPGLHRRDNDRMEVRQHDILKDELEEDYYDLVCSRALLQHLPQPELALSRMAQAVKPGGWILIEEIYNWIMRAAEEDTPSAEIFNHYFFSMCELGKQMHTFAPGLAARVRPMIEQLGFEDVSNEGVVHIVHGGEPWARALEILYRAGWEKVKEIQTPEIVKLRAAYEEVAKLLADPSFYFSGDNLFCAWGRKPE